MPFLDFTCRLNKNKVVEGENNKTNSFVKSILQKIHEIKLLLFAKKRLIVLFVLIIFILLGIGGFFLIQGPLRLTTLLSGHTWGGRLGGAEIVGGNRGQAPEKRPDMPPRGEARKNGTDFPLPPMEANLPPLTLPEGTPKGEWVTKNLGNVEVKYFSTAIIWGLSESGTDFFITLKNKGNDQTVVNFTPVKSLVETIPKWNLHFFSLQEPPLILKPGDEKKLWYMASLDQAGKFPVNFKLWLNNNTANYLELPVVFGTIADDSLFRRMSSLIYGYLKDENGKPLAGVEVSAQMNCGRLGNRGVSDEQGRYFVPVLGKEDIDVIYQGKELACESTDYFISAEKDGYEYYFKDHISPTKKNSARADIVLEKKKENASFSLAWEKQVDEPYGFFWAKPSADWSVFAVSQAKHEPQLNKPTNFYLFDSSGNILWKQPTGNECWGIDIASDGSKVIAGCHDGKIYVVSREGNLLWSFNTGAMVRSACFNNDGKTALSGTTGNLFLFDAVTGSKNNISWPGGWLRNCLFYPDNSGFIAGSPEIGGFTIVGKQNWQQLIGEFPMFLGIDKNKNIFAAGKSRSLFSFDVSGNLRWKKRIPDHVVTMGGVTSDGQRVVVGTIGGMVHLFDGNGNLLWRQHLNSGMTGDSAGHNAVAMSPDGERIVVGSAPGNCVFVYNGKGTLLWKDCTGVEKIKADMRPGVTNVQISPDKKKIIATYGDNFIREFIIK